MLSQAFGPGSIEVVSEFENWKTALDRALQLLVDSGRTTINYAVEVHEHVERLGPYFVVAPGIAFIHAAPSDSVIVTGLSLAVSKKGVDLGTPNDPVSLFFGLASKNGTDHIEIMAELSDFLTEPSNVKSLLNISSEEEFRNLLQRNVRQ